MADRLQTPLTSTLRKRKSDDDLGKQNAMEHEAAVQSKEDWTHREWEGKGEEGKAEDEGGKAEDESRKVKDEEVKVKDEIVQRAINMFTISDVEIQRSAFSYLAARRREN
jgi:hypothetical protein